MLKTKNAHPRDSKIVFDEGPHLYYIDGDSDNTSVTTLVHHFFDKFDADRVIDKMMQSKKWCDSKYYGMSREDIKKQWSDAGLEASTMGTRMHRSIELFYNEENTAPYEDDTEFQMFKVFEAEHDYLKAYRTEWEIYDKDLHLAGSVDMVFRNELDEYYIFDWKRSKEIKFENPWSNGKGVMKDHCDCNFVTYSLQLNIYRYILEKRYGLKIAGMFLVVIHPTATKYSKLACLDLRQEVASIMQEREQNLKLKRQNAKRFD